MGFFHLGVNYMKQGKIISVMNQKGGVGKTATTVNLGVGLARQGKRVLLVDADPQASLTVCLVSKTPDELPVTLTDVLRAAADDRPAPEHHGILRSAEGVDVLPSNIELAAFEVSMIGIMSREYLLRDALTPLREQYDYILIDCMPSLGMMCINALSAADSVLIPTQASYLSAKGLTLLLGSITKVKRQINPALQIDGVLLTMVDNRTNNAKAVSSALRAAQNQLPVFESEIPFSVRMAESTAEGKSIFSFDPRGKVAAAYESLTKEVMQHEREKTTRSRSDERA